MKLNSRWWKVNRRDMPTSRPGPWTTFMCGSSCFSRFYLLDTDKHRCSGSHVFKMVQLQCWRDLGQSLLGEGELAMQTEKRVMSAFEARGTEKQPKGYGQGSQGWKPRSRNRLGVLPPKRGVEHFRYSTKRQCLLCAWKSPVEETTPKLRPRG